MDSGRALNKGVTFAEHVCQTVPGGGSTMSLPQTVLPWPCLANGRCGAAAGVEWSALVPPLGGKLPVS